MFCEKAIELIRELHRMSDGQLPAFNVSDPGDNPGLHPVFRGSGLHSQTGYFNIYLLPRAE